MLSNLNLNFRNAILLGLLIVAAVWTLWTAYNLRQESKALQSVEDTDPDGFMREAHIMQLNAQGVPELVLHSPKLVHYPDKSTDINDPHFMIYSDNNPEPWHVYAVYGRTVNGFDVLYLWDDVRIVREASKSNEKTTILTSELSFYPNQKYIETLKEVTFIQPTTIVKSLGVRAYEDGRIELLSNVRGQHVPAENSSPSLRFLPGQ